MVLFTFFVVLFSFYVVMLSLRAVLFTCCGGLVYFLCGPVKFSPDIVYSLRDLLCFVDLPYLVFFFCVVLLSFCVGVFIFWVGPVDLSLVGFYFCAIVFIFEVVLFIFWHGRSYFLGDHV